MAYVVRPEVLREAARRMAVEAGRRPEKTEMRGGDGRLEYQIPTAMFVNAVAGHGVSPHDDEYWRDNARRVPGCVVAYRPRKPRVFTGEVSSQDAKDAKGGERVVTRFGRGIRFRYA